MSITYPRSVEQLRAHRFDESPQFLHADVGRSRRKFDVDADGDLDEVAWTEAGTDVAFLALDRDGDGRISSGQELIGDRTVPGARNGVRALTELAAQPEPLSTVHSGIPVSRLASLDGCESQRRERG